MLLQGVVRTRGRAWVASQPDIALWLESAGGGMRVGHAGPWLASQAGPQWSELDSEQQLKASLNWDEDYGDRMQELVVIAHEASPDDIRQALLGAVLTDDELAEGEVAWRHYPDPFGEWHEDPCEDLGEDSGGEQAESDQEPASQERRNQ